MKDENNKMELDHQLENNKKIFENIKASYSKQVMPEQSVEQMKEKIRLAKAMNRIQKRRRCQRVALATAACLALVVFVIPNTSEGAAVAMKKVPGLSKVVEVAVVRDYGEKEDKDIADIDVAAVSVTAAKESSEEELESAEVIPEDRVETISDQIVAEFKASVKNNEGYKDVLISSAPMEITDDYFTLRIDCCLQSGASAAQWSYYYTIDLDTGKTVKLKDLFKEDSNYIEIISENIKDQMRSQMKENEEVTYWIDSEDYFEEWDFEEITEDTSFYLDSKGNVVICFDEGEVAPMCAGNVTFVIPQDVIEAIRK